MMSRTRLTGMDIVAGRVTFIPKAECMQENGLPQIFAEINHPKGFFTKSWTAKEIDDAAGRMTRQCEKANGAAKQK